MRHKDPAIWGLGLPMSRTNVYRLRLPGSGTESVVAIKQHL